MKKSMIQSCPLCSEKLKLKSISFLQSSSLVSFRKRILFVPSIGSPKQLLWKLLENFSLVCFKLCFWNHGDVAIVWRAKFIPFFSIVDDCFNVESLGKTVEKSSFLYGWDTSSYDLFLESARQELHFDYSCQNDWVKFSSKIFLEKVPKSVLFHKSRDNFLSTEVLSKTANADLKLRV